jgi:hypothetical protein
MQFRFECNIVRDFFWTDVSPTGLFVTKYQRLVFITILSVSDFPLDSGRDIYIFFYILTTNQLNSCSSCLQIVPGTSICLFLSNLRTLTLARLYRIQWKNEKRCLGKNFLGNVRGTIEIIAWTLLEWLRKTTKSIRIVDFHAEMQTVPNTTQERYRYSTSLCGVWFFKKWHWWMFHQIQGIPCFQCFSFAD